MKIIFLLPPSEGKNPGGIAGVEKLNFVFEKPLDIAVRATEKDLKCNGKRYQQGIELNKNILESEKLSAIGRYSGVMYNAINYTKMNTQGKQYFEDNFKILSGMYGIVSPLDMIGNYKLPIETKGLCNFWGTQITQTLNFGQYDYIVDLLPISYAKMIDWKHINSQIIRVNFLHIKDGELKKITHGVKKVKGEYIKDLCEKSIEKIEKFPGKLEKIGENIFQISVISK